MANIIRLDKFSEDQNVATIITWLKKEGDRIEVGDVLLELETDKSTMELEAEVEGYLLYIKIPLGKVIVDDILCVIGEKNENLDQIFKEEEIRIEGLIDKAKGVDIIRLPKLSEMMEEARIVDWKVEVGDDVKKGDIIAEVETDKAVIEVESFREGKVLYRVPSEKQTLKENDILVIIGEEGAHIQNILKGL